MSSDANDALITNFYAAFGARDGATMASCYAPDAKFSDPVFPDLKGDEPGLMWKMLTERADDLVIELAEHDASEDSGTAHWIATYTFTQTGRKVVNDVHAHFRFKDGKISEHMDDFSFYNWSRQALGASGLLLGWTPIIRGAVQKKARAGLDQYTSAR
ncbi:MAG: nuclear transport factor 2 family protein [Thermoleophilaceae bacterium]|nr:nuclear transport factor 2 family protein [Thermoleophilaceae bacterium]